MPDEPSKHMYTGIGGGTLTKQPDDQMVSLYLIKKIDALDERIARFETGQYHEMINLIKAIAKKVEWVVARESSGEGFGVKDYASIVDSAIEINSLIKKSEASE